jgi:pyruvate-formate lyase-activating enzyme
VLPEAKNEPMTNWPDLIVVTSSPVSSTMPTYSWPIKAFTDDFYHRVSAGHLQPVLDTLVHLRHRTDVWFEITTLLIPGHNDSDAEIDAECGWISDHLGPDVPLHFTAFHPDFKIPRGR